MTPSFAELKQNLKAKNINLSFQRLKVLEYLVNNRCHPSVEQIFSDLLKELPTLSKTTVYNTLRILTETGLVRSMTIDDNETRYDINTKNHGHFKCNSCHTIYDFYVDIDNFCSDDLKNFKIENKNVYFMGICPRCLTNKE
ncbi:MAG: transcriptional repressor [Clostridia bacterium]|nr:transcriptional repressor [Clostridia bacterium]